MCVGLFSSTDAMEALSSSPQPTSEGTSESDDPVPNAPPLYPVLPAGSSETPTHDKLDDEQTPTNTPNSSPMIYRSRSDFNMQRVRLCSCKRT